MPTAAAPAPQIAERLSLHGRWRRSIAGAPIDLVPVPGGYEACGACDLATSFARPAGWRDGDRVFLVSEGVLAAAAFALNGVRLGDAGPWARYRFELPPGALREANELTAAMTDLPHLFGPVPGRRFEGGLFREIWLERRPATFIADATFRYRFAGDVAECVVDVELDGSGSPTAQVRLSERAGGRVVATGTAARGSPARLRVERPLRWSPAVPNLYRLEVTLPDDGWSEDVGFREIEIRGRDFVLNGERLVLKGVCRHEFMYPWGYAPPLDEVRRELARIRHAGFNYVRLVHSPQHPAIPRMASELGIFLTEEPGTCWQDLDDEAIAAPAVEALRRTVLRDRNCPSLFAWHISNECHASVAYATRIAAMCRELDPDRLLSYADCFGPEDKVQEMTAKAGLSYYGINAYSYWPGDFEKKMDAYADRPLVFTEWGGGMAQGNRRVLGDLCATFARATRVEATRRIAGFAFWAWADYEEYSRPGPCAIEGWTVEGLIDRRREAKEDLAVMSQLCFDIDHPAPPPRRVASVELGGAPRAQRWSPVDLDAIAWDQSAVEQALAQRRAAYGGADPTIGRVAVGGIEFSARGGEAGARPLLLGEDRREGTIAIGRDARRIAVLGHVAWRRAWPASSLKSPWWKDDEEAAAAGELAATYELVFDDRIERIELKHGEDVLRANAIMRWWRTAPRAPRTQPALTCVVDRSYEHWRADLWERDLGRTRRLREIRWRLVDERAILPLYAISVAAE